MAVIGIMVFEFFFLGINCNMYLGVPCDPRGKVLRGRL